MDVSGCGRENQRQVLWGSPWKSVVTMPIQESVVPKKSRPRHDRARSSNHVCISPNIPFQPHRTTSFFFLNHSKDTSQRDTSIGTKQGVLVEDTKITFDDRNEFQSRTIDRRPASDRRRRHPGITCAIPLRLTQSQLHLDQDILDRNQDIFNTLETSGDYSRG